MIIIKSNIINAIKYYIKHKETVKKHKITKLFNVDKTTLKKYLNYLDEDKNFIKDLYYNPKEDVYFKISAKEQKAIEDYNNGLNFFQIRKKYGIHQEYLEKTLKNISESNDENYKKRYKRHWNRNAFSEIKNTKDAYFLGFLLADGCVTDNNSLCLKVHERDRDIIEKFSNYMGLSLNHIREEIHTITHNKICKVSFSGKQLSENLKQYHIVPRKSRKELPYLELPHHLIKHYIRGIIDGDGFISKRELPKIGLCGSKEVLNFVLDFLTKELDLTFQKTFIGVRYDPLYDLHRLEFCGNNAKKVMTYLYKNSKIHLNRKYNLAKRFFID